MINKHRHVLETDDTLKQLFPKNSIIVANKRGRNLQEILTRADPYIFMAIKNAIHVTILLMKPLLLYQKQLDGNIG